VCISASDDARDKASGTPGEEADGELAFLAEQRAAGDIDGAVGGTQGFLCLFQEDPALRGQAGGALGAIQERAADLMLQVGDLLRDGALRDVEMAAGLAEGAELGDGAEVAQVTELHGSIVLSSVFPFKRRGKSCETIRRLELSYSLRLGRTREALRVHRGMHPIATCPDRLRADCLKVLPIGSCRSNPP
jgi:hypothetical protein